MHELVRQVPPRLAVRLQVDALGLELLREQGEAAHALGADLVPVDLELVLHPDVDRTVLGPGQDLPHPGRELVQEPRDAVRLLQRFAPDLTVGRDDRDRRRRSEAACQAQEGEDEDR